MSRPADRQPRVGFRFRPPARELSNGERWALSAALGPLQGIQPATGCEEDALQAARAFGLAARIASRQAEPDLRRLAGARAEEFLQDRRRAATQTVRCEPLLEQIRKAGGEVEARYFLLKGAALWQGSYAPLGSRPFADIDLLVSEAHARPLHHVLRAQGLAGPEAPRNEHHLVPLANEWGVVEVHFCLRGLSDREGRWWRWGDVQNRVDAGSDQPSEPEVPPREVLAAHAIAHAVDQHGLAPGNHRLLTLFGDLQDLTPPGEDGTRWLNPVATWLEESLAARELGATFELFGQLSRGQLPSPGTDEDRLLRHMVLASTSPPYRRSFRRRRFLHRLSDARRQGELVRFLLRKSRSSLKTELLR